MLMSPFAQMPIILHATPSTRHRRLPSLHHHRRHAARSSPTTPPIYHRLHYASSLMSSSLFRRAASLQRESAKMSARHDALRGASVTQESRELICARARAQRGDEVLRCCRRYSDIRAHYSSGGALRAKGARRAAATLRAITHERCQPCRASSTFDHIAGDV